MTSHLAVQPLDGAHSRNKILPRLLHKSPSASSRSSFSSAGYSDSDASYIRAPSTAYTTPGSPVDFNPNQKPGTAGPSRSTSAAALHQARDPRLAISKLDLLLRTPSPAHLRPESDHGGDSSGTDNASVRSGASHKDTSRAVASPGPEPTIDQAVIEPADKIAVHDHADVADDSPRDLIVPHPLAQSTPQEHDPEKSPPQDEILPQGPKLAVADPEKHQATTLPITDHKQDVRWTHRLWNNFRDAYCPNHDFELILPTGPTDKEKYSYLHTNRLLLYMFGMVSFLSLSVGMWLFVLSSVIFAWFGVFFGLLQIYLAISYLVSIVGKDFDFEEHKQILEDHPIDPITCPTVDVYLPCCKEPLEVLENTYKHVKELIYPEGKLKVYVMDDGAMDSVKVLAESYGFTYFCRDDRPRLKKAGNLRWTFARTSGDFFNIYDADFCPRPDFLLETIPQHLADPKTAIIQTPQFFRVKDEQTWTEQGASAVQELFYRVVEVNRNRWGASICVGSNALYRRAALEEVGGTAEIGFSEDVHTGFGAVHRGWKLKYLPLCLACGICPDTPRAFFSQQMRWCMGSTTLLTNPEFWVSSLSLVQKVCYLCGMMYYSAMALSIFISPVPGIFLLWFRPEFFRYYNLAFALPSVLYGLIAFHLWAKASYGINVQYIMVIQSYAYLTAIKDRLLGTALQWAPSGDNKAHKNNKYRNMRILCCCWMFTVTGTMVGGMAYRILLGMHWWNCVPLLCLNTYNLFVAHRFMFYSG